MSVASPAVDATDQRAPGVDPGGPFWRASLTILRDVVLGQVGDWIDGPPGWWWAGLQTASFLAVWLDAWLGAAGLPVVPPGYVSLLTHGDRARVLMSTSGLIYGSWCGGSLAAWLGFKAWRIARRQQEAS